MKCEHVQELFPELQEAPQRYPEAMTHIAGCGSCRKLFEAFRTLIEQELPPLEKSRHDASCQNIYKSMFKHDVWVAGSRIATAAAVLLLVFFSVFSPDRTSSPSLSDISDEVLYLESRADIIPEPEVQEEAIIEYLVYNEYIEELGNIY
jgi:hypothetical protein